ncbi:MAG: VWA domain-containing protein [Bacteroidota bacterium]
MNLWTRIEDEFSTFIRTGQLMNESLRLFTAEWLYHWWFDPTFEARKELERSGLAQVYPNWYHLLEKLLEEKELRKLTLNNEDFAFSVTRETLSWCKKTYLEFEANNPYIDEEKRLKKWEAPVQREAFQDWQQELANLGQLYPSQASNWDFYAKALEENSALLQEESLPAQRKERVQQDLNVVQANILNDWEEVLQRKKSLEESGFLEERFSDYFHELRHKVDQLQELGELLAPFYNFLGQAWNHSIENWDRMDWDELENFARQLKRDTHLRELAELLGRWRKAERVKYEQELEQPTPRQAWNPNPYGKSEVIGIHHSDQLSHMLPSEVALLSTPETEVILSKKYVEKKLLTFQYRSMDLGTYPRQKQAPKMETEDEGRGPIIMCIDTSGSMFGTPERIAKALALAILNISIQQKRRAYIISFSTGIQTMELNGMEKDFGKVVEFLRMGFHGGTDLQPALQEALSMLKEENFQLADILVISDFLVPRLDRQLYDKVLEVREQYGTNFHSLFITRRPDPRIPPLPIFDNHWIYDLDNPGVMRQTIDHFQTFEEESSS